MSVIDAEPRSDIPLLDPAPRRLGPVSRVLLARLVLGLAAVQALGAALILTSDSPASRAAGGSLIFPGAGFLYLGRPFAFAATLVALGVAVVLWWGLSAHLAIPVVWATSAALGALAVDAPRVLAEPGTTYGWALWSAPLLALATVAAGIAKFERRFRAKRAEIPELNDYLAGVTLEPVVVGHREPDDVDVELLRFCYDLADQDDDGLDGLDWGEQFHGGTQLRYQLNAHSWALSLYAANYLPNGQHQIEPTLGRLIHKHTDLRVWKYWRTLNLLGNFDADPDPIAKDNIMFSAFLGDVLNTFEAATGSDRFDQPGSLTFVWSDGRTFPYDHHSIVDAVRANYERSKLGFFPCEPGWSFTVCNIMGAQSMHGHDVLHGTDHWAQRRDAWRKTLDEEYLTPDGTYAHIRSNLVGLSWDTGEVPDGHYTTNGTGRMADVLPTHGDRARALDLRKAGPAMAMLATMITDGDLPLDMPEELERHRTASSALPGWNKVVGGARLVGDDRLAEAALAGAARQCATGQHWPERPLAAGSSAFGSHLIVRWAAPLDLAGLHQRGYVAPSGPRVGEGLDPTVLLALARSPDDDALDVALAPRSGGDADERIVDLPLTDLAPGAEYRVAPWSPDPDADPGHSASDPAAFTADGDGRATASVVLRGRTRVRIERAEAGR